MKPLTFISGLLTGRFYSETGEPTDTLLQTEASLAKGQRIKAQSEAEKLHFPPCNSQWSAADGGRVWCTNKRYGNSSELIKYYYHHFEYPKPAFLVVGVKLVLLLCTQIVQKPKC